MTAFRSFLLVLALAGLTAGRADAGFASLVVASFGGSRRDKAVAHLGLALTGSVGIIIGTAVNGIQWLAVLVTIPVSFGIFFAGVASPNDRSMAVTAAAPVMNSAFITFIAAIVRARAASSLRCWMIA